MTNAIESEQLTRVGPGTMMGDLMRQYWLPAAKSSEVVAGGDPVRLMLLGEKLIAFRDHAGRVGVMDHRCPHRCASLFYGRNEEGGMRCVYHGWKFDADGNCIDMPNLPPEQDFRAQGARQGLQGDRARRRDLGLYGRAREAPPMPDDRGDAAARERLSIMFTPARMQLAAGAGRRHRHLAFRLAACRQSCGRSRCDPDNWLMYQVSQPRAGIPCDRYRLGHDVLRLSSGRGRARPTGGSRISASRSGPSSRRATSSIASSRAPGCRWTTRTRCSCAFTWKQASRTATLADGKPIPGATPAPDYQPNTTDWYGRWRPVQNAANDYLIDREAQRNDEIYTGITHIAMQDQAITESMGDDRRSLVRASGAERSDDHPHAAASADGGAGVAREGRGAALRG